MSSPSVAFVIPTLNAAADWPHLLRSLQGSVSADQVLVIDSSSTDGTPDLVRSAGYRLHTVLRSEFNHGGTRQLAVRLLPQADLLVFLTQDVRLAGADAIAKLVEGFKDPKIAAVFGRQLPRHDAMPIEAHARFFNYPAVSSVRTLDSRVKLGFKAIFISNSFAAYRRTALMEVGGFPDDVIFGEDTTTAAKLLLAGWQIGYVAEAQAHHSHSYTWTQEFKRYFDIGVLHSREGWLLREFGGASSEGGRFVRSELRYLWHGHARYLPSALVRTFLKFAGYKLGRSEGKLSLRLKRKLSMHSTFWK
jgi:rhamnosyltransferase